MDLQYLPNESVCHTGARRRDCRGDDEVEDMEDTEWWMDERKAALSIETSAVP